MATISTPKQLSPIRLPLFKAPWPEQNLTQGNGPLMARYMLYGDGKVYENEPERFQFGKHARLDWGLEGMPAVQFERGDFMAEGDSMTYIPLLPFGLRGIDDRDFDTLLGRMFLDGHPDASAPAGFASIGTPADDNLNPYLRAYQENFAARAQWCAHDPAICSHPAHVVEVTADRSAAAGERVALAATIVDPDDKGFDAHWDVAVDPSSYAASRTLSMWQECTVDTAFIVPADAQPGDRFVLTLTVQTRAERPCTRYAQIAVTVA